MTTRTLRALCLAAFLAASVAWQPQPAPAPAPSAALERHDPAGRSAAASAPRHQVLLRFFRGRSEKRNEVNVTTLLGAGGPPIVETPDITAASPAASDDELRGQLAAAFSLPEVVALGSAVTSFGGGRALLDDDAGLPLEVRIDGRQAGSHSVLLILSLRRGGREELATSLMVRSGRTVIVAGPQSPPEDGECLILIAVTVIEEPTHS